ADIVGTDTLLSEAQSTIDRDQLRQALAREDVAAQLEAYGVSTEDALLRVDRMTDQEVVALNEKIGELPAGGDILGVALVVFIVLVFTDIIGATDIFPFIRPVSN
ncbi:MAG: DUF6627 family protein, partial [Pseudomonadota bacterium]